MKGLAENIVTPNLGGVFLEFIGDVAGQIGALPLRTHQRCDFRIDVGTNHMNGRGAGFQLNAEQSSLLDQLRLFQSHLIH
ncbi:hypothetical protein SDC9_185488 [bioreactor metagenome]|uniref:Uncharacterized protein n=1 Tax=bioreactor metagenome TaxID=1076179 RepID=A0A645HG03_9ZZZZ